MIRIKIQWRHIESKYVQSVLYVSDAYFHVKLLKVEFIEREEKIMSRRCMCGQDIKGMTVHPRPDESALLQGIDVEAFILIDKEKVCKRI